MGSVIGSGFSGSYVPEDFTRAVDLMEEYKLDYEDLIHLAVAIRTGTHEILSNDKDFDAAPIKRNI